MATIITSVPVPQADDLDKVFEVVRIVGEGHTTSMDIADRLEMVDRQGFYYAAAAEQMGLIERDEHAHSYTLTKDGEVYLHAPDELTRSMLRKKAVIKHPLVKYLGAGLGIKRVGVSHLHLFEDTVASADCIEELGYARETAERRATTLKSWVKNLVA